MTEQSIDPAAQALGLNHPMVKRLRGCAADTSSNWEGAVTVYPPEARQLVDLIDRLADSPAPQSDGEDR